MQAIQPKTPELDLKKIAETMTTSEVTTANQAASFTNKLMMKLLPWCKLRRTKFVFRDAFSCDDISSVIIRSKVDKSSNRFFTGLRSNPKSQASIYGRHTIKTTTLPPPPPPPPPPSSKAHHHPSRHHHLPMVSFINKGEGLVTVDAVVDRVMVNDNELYSISMDTSSSAFSSSHSLSNTSSSLSSSKSTRTIYPTDSLSSSDCDNCLPQWFYGPICRDAAISVLSRQHIGCFLVRESISKPGCYALSLRVPKRCQVSGVAHYLILRTPQANFKIKGFSKEFSSLNSLIIHHSIMQELLPCPLNLASIQHRDEVDISITETCTKFMGEPMVGNYDNNEEEELVDIDSDPDYQRILSQFRKTMANCK